VVTMPNNTPGAEGRCAFPDCSDGRTSHVPHSVDAHCSGEFCETFWCHPTPPVAAEAQGGARGFRAAVEGDELVLRMPIDLLANAANKHPDLPQGLVKDERAYAEWVAKNFVGFDEDGAGFTSLYRMLDRLTMAAYEGGNL
jgi:hypothetical protein